MPEQIGLKIKKTRLIRSNGFINILILFNTFLNRLIAIEKMMLMCLNKSHASSLVL
jgi:hypothetical protein|tara:strand:+ start:25063 stop:25230 length:168 start_codon:yes stop_codon:yes gene_type:complete